MAQTKEEESKTKALLLALLFAHKTIRRIMAKTAVAPAQTIFERTIGQVATGLGRLLKGKARTPLTPVDTTLVRDFIHRFLAQLPPKIGGVLESVASATRAESLNVLDRIFTAGGKPQGVILAPDLKLDILLAQESVDAAVLRQLETAIERDLFAAIEKRLLELGRAGPVTGSSIIGETTLALDSTWWQLKRTVSTNASAVFNGTMAKAVTILAQKPEFSGLQLRWVEMITDPDGVPMDTRVGEDSKVLHGQIVHPGKQFAMPADPKAPPRMVGMSWSHPPNRPNDRAIVTPWFPEWNRALPAYRTENGTKRPFKGSPP